MSLETGLGFVGVSCTVLGLLGTVNFFTIRSVVRNELAEFEKKINGTYKRSEECKIIEKEVDRRLIYLEGSKVRRTAESYNE